jgi:putative ABC transport system permease protein
MGLGLAQVVPAVVRFILGATAGVALFHALAVSPTATPPFGQIVGLAVLTVICVAGLTAIPARLEARRPVAATLREP